MNKVEIIIQKYQLLIGLSLIAASIFWSGMNIRYSTAALPGAIVKFDQRTGEITWLCDLKQLGCYRWQRAADQKQKEFNDSYEKSLDDERKKQGLK